MPKRRAVANDSDSEELEYSSQGSKRARTDDSGYDTPGPSQNAGRSRRKTRRANEGPEDDDDENVEQTTPDEDEEQRFEDEHEDEIRAKVLSKSKTQGVSLLLHL